MADVIEAPQNTPMDTAEDKKEEEITPASPEEHKTLVNIILAAEATPKNPIAFKTSDDVVFEKISEEVYLKFLVVKNLLDGTEPDDDRVIPMLRIASGAMKDIIALGKICACTKYDKRLTLEGALNAYFEDLWARTNAEKMSDFVPMANAVNNINFEEVLDPLRAFFLEKLGKTSAGREYREFRVHVGYPADGGFTQQRIDEIVNEYPPAKEWLEAPAE